MWTKKEEEEKKAEEEVQLAKYMALTKWNKHS